jgi:hypothetical protein
MFAIKHSGCNPKEPGDEQHVADGDPDSYQWSAGAARSEITGKKQPVRGNSEICKQSKAIATEHYERNHESRPHERRATRHPGD